MKAPELITILKDRLSEDQYEFNLDAKTNKLRIQHRSLNKGMELVVGDVLQKYEERKEAAIDEVLYIIQKTFEAMAKEQNEGFAKGLKIFPAIRSGSFPKKSKEGIPFIYEKHTAETTIFYALDLGATYRLIDEAMLEKLELTEAQVKEMARFQVKTLPTDVKADEVNGNIFYFLNHNDGYDASRILNEPFLQHMAEQVEGDMTVSVPHQDVLIVGDIRNKEGYDILAQMTMHFFSVGAVPITSLSFIYENNHLEPIFIMAKAKKEKE